MSMITVALRSRHDMATWSNEIVEEREVLMKEVSAHCRTWLYATLLL